MRAQIVKLSNRVALLLLMVMALPAAAADQGEQKPIGRTIEQPGYVRPIEQVDIYAGVTGKVAEVNVDLGDHVKKGQILAKLAVPQLEQKLDQHKALVLKAQAGVARAKAGALLLTTAVEQQQAALEQAKAGVAKCQAEADRWKIEVERAEKLVAKGIYDKATLDETRNQWNIATAAEAQARAQVKTAEAVLKAAVVQREQGKTDIEVAQADLQAAQAEAAQMDTMLQYAQVRAPFDGVVIARKATVGTLAGPPSGAKAEPLFTLARLDRVRVVVQVPESDALRVVKGMEATIRFQVLPGMVFKGTVARTSGALDPKTRTLHVEIELPNPEGTLLPGMNGNVVLTPKTAQPK